MTIRTKKVILVTTVTAVLLSCGTVIAKQLDKQPKTNFIEEGVVTGSEKDSESSIDNMGYLNPKVGELTRLKEEYIRKGEKVPEELEAKIEFEKEYEVQLREDEKKRLEDEKEYQEKIKNAPKDEKGYPILNTTPLKHGFGYFSEEAQVIEKMEEDDSTPSHVFGRRMLEYKINTMAKSKTSILASGCRKDNEDIGVIYNKIYSPTEFEISLGKYEYPGKGGITFKSYADDNNILIFSYGDGEEGYFDSRTNETVFEKYNGN
jgi:hypothetical protein